MTQNEAQVAKLRKALSTSNSSARLRAALTAGTYPDPEYVDVLIEQSATEPDFFVRDMLTWALTRHDGNVTVDQLLRELGSAVPQARSQSLHTLSKIGDRRAWPAITADLLRDSDDEVARAAWRAAVALVPDGDRTGLAEALASQFGRGDGEVQLSLSRAFAALGPAATGVLERATSDRDPAVQTHAIATQRLIDDPDLGFAAAVDAARREIALIDAPVAAE
ncbi:HEAT repeat domain-containing protein [Epidermidibacterium keratini]|uniref:HEAT repeat domain-containing protein n=1 Tax=Epidermidibacterium keratini TaxID=1891644 RepID=A0A7M3T518_9ACTN|nr:HEAT repeat domain-containing protein [Epidermidibacterium keratini]QHB98873.1 HEAT repeat domain-containing protein [Epidermidibacterium keratini]